VGDERDTRLGHRFGSLCRFPVGDAHRQHKGLNNRAENSHQPTRRRERQMKQFKSAGQAQRRASRPRSSKRLDFETGALL
jgi:transposase-like protein